MAIKVKEGEDFSNEKIEKVIAMLNTGQTKKSCCDLLGMSYNTTRLGKIISTYELKKENDSILRKKLRNKSLDEQDIKYICQEYLNGEPLSGISDSIYRSTNVIKNVLKRYNIPLRNVSHDYFHPVFIDEDEFLDYKTGDLVFSARYNATAEIINLVEEGVYKICVLGKNQRYAYQPAYELADLRKLQKEFGITGEWETETRQRAWAAVLDAKKRKKDSR